MTFSPEEFARLQRGMHGPAWRIITATPSATRPGTPSAMHDETLRHFIRYRRLAGEDSSGIERAAAAYPTIAAAERLNDDQERTAPLKLMILADMSYDEMLAHSGIDLVVLRTWELLRFDARGQQKATDWLAVKIINHERKMGDPRFASKMKLAIIAGPVAVRAMLDTDKGVQLDEADRLFQRKIALSEKLDVAVEMPIDSPENCLRYMKLHIDLMTAEKRIALAERKLTQRCAEAHQRYELAKLRLEQAAEHAAGEQKKGRRKAEERERRPAARRPVAPSFGTSQQSRVEGAVVGAEQPVPPSSDARKSVSVDGMDAGTIEQWNDLIPAA